MNRRMAHLRALVETGLELSGDFCCEAVLQRIVEQVVELAGCRYGALAVLDNQGRIAQLYTAGVDPSTRAAIGHLPEGKGILEVAIREQKVLRLRDLTRDPRACGFPPHHPPMKSFLGVPIIAQGQVLGELYLAERQEAEAFSAEDEALVVALARHAAIAIENARLFQEME
ncbi:MAG: GAF domain-containing protein, partial [Dehalococcoidia bacterium]